MVDFKSSNAFQYQIQLPITGKILVLLKGRLLELAQGMALHADLQKTIENMESANVLLNLQNLEFINSEGLNALIRCLSLVRKNGGELCLFNPNQNLKNLFLSTRLNEVFDSVEDFDAWLKLPKQ
jgi:anti-anti-sigma factor